MKNLKLVLLVAVFVTLAAPLLAAEMGLSSGHDLDELWATAQQDYDLDRQDAVLLLESRQVSWDPAGTVTTRVHRVVWIGTSVGIRAYADLRIPWNTATSQLDVELLRTWREGRWWPDPTALSATAMVETLPHAVDHADDYTTMRETMLLHDGVELPCIMETAYTITENGLPGTDGQFVLAQRDPAVQVELQVTVPTDTPLQFESLNGTPTVRVTEDVLSTTRSWVMSPVPALSMPGTVAAVIHEPAVVWSTWTDWTELRDHWRSVFDSAAVLDEALADSVKTWLDPAPTRWSRLEAVTDQINRNVRGIHYPDRFWTYQPRSAVRTWDTAYGHSLDRAVLVAALLREAGYEVTPVFVGSGNSFVAPTVARMAGVGHLHLSIKGDPAGLYDPAVGTLSGQAPLIGLPLWRTDQYVEPFLGNSQWPNRLEVTLTLEPGEEGSWQGSGQFHGSGVFCPQGDMAGPGDGARDFLAGVVQGVVPGAELTSANPEIFHQHQVVFGYAAEVAKPEPEDSGLTRLVIGAPGHGMEGFSGGIHLYDESRRSPVLLPGPMQQWVKVRLRSEDTAAHLPEPFALANEAGEFTVTVTQQDGWITLTRELKLNEGTYPAEMWPAVRALLLEESDARHGTILLD